MLQSPPATAPPSTPSTMRPSRQGLRTTARRGCGRIIIPTTTAPSCLIRTGTTSKRFVTSRVETALMLPLNDPLWKKLDDAHRDRSIPDVLAGLAESWNDEAANSLFWDCLCHLETCYGATYAAIPHLLKIAESESARHQRFEIALFSGFVALCALRPRKEA